MNSATLLHILMAVHTLIGAISTFCLFYLYVAAWRRRDPRRDRVLLAALVWPFADLILMAVNGMVCPMQDWAQALSGQHAGWVRDIYWVPESWLRLVPWTYSVSYVLGAVLVFARIRKPPASKSAPPPHPASP